MNTEDFNKAVKPLSDKWTEDLVKDGLINKSKTPRTDKAEPKIQFIKGGWVRADFARELEKELNDLKKELDNSKFGAQCSIHKLEYDKKTLIKDNEVLWSRLDKEMEAEQLLGAVIQIAEDLIEVCGTIDPYKFAQKKKSQLDKIKETFNQINK
jgi:hypothetical protein